MFSSGMSSGMDKLERLFRKKPTSARSSVDTKSKCTASSPSSPVEGASPSGNIHFPQASFIRPKAIKLLPRDDSNVVSRPSTANRSHITPDTACGSAGKTMAPAVTCGERQDRSRSSSRVNSIGSSGRFNSIDSPGLNIDSSFSSGDSTASTIAASRNTSISTIDSFPPVPNRSASLLDCREASIAPLDSQTQSLHLSPASASSGEISPTTTFQSVSSPTDQRLPQKLPLQPTYSQPGNDTPPQSDHEENMYSPQLSLEKQTSSLNTAILPTLPLPTASQPTPDASPEMPATSGPLLPGPKPILPDFAQTTLRQLDSVTGAKNVISEDVLKPMPPSPATRRKNRLARRPASILFIRRLPAERPQVSTNAVLREPKVGDFLSLSDDDIAEAEPAQSAEVAAQPSTTAPEPATPNKTCIAAAAASASPSAASPPSVQRRRKLCLENPPSHPPTFMAPPRPLAPSRLKLLPPPLIIPAVSATALPSRCPQTPAGQARMVAAFEMARIASQYKFDLAYIATIWPRHMAVSQCGSGGAAAAAVAACAGNRQSSQSVPAPGNANKRLSCQSVLSSTGTFSSTTSTRSTATATASISSRGSPGPANPHRHGLEAQFLAAYGLANVKAPYSLSARTHTKILNADCWLAFNEPDAKSSDLSTGYGCAFYPGHAPVQAPRKQRLRRNTASRRRFVDDCDADSEQDSQEDESGRSTPRPTAPMGRTASVTSGSTSSSGNTMNNRGIVFVAYRRKGAENAAPVELHDDLVALYRDVENLVNRILDAHLTQQRQAQLAMLRAEPGLADDLLARPGAVIPCSVQTGLGSPPPHR